MKNRVFAAAKDLGLATDKRRPMDWSCRQKTRFFTLSDKLAYLVVTQSTLGNCLVANALRVKKFNGITHGDNFLRLFVVDLAAKFFFKLHDQFH